MFYSYSTNVENSNFDRLVKNRKNIFVRDHRIFLSSNFIILTDFGNHKLIFKKVYINTKFEN